MTDPRTIIATAGKNGYIAADVEATMDETWLAVADAVLVALTTAGYRLKLGLCTCEEIGGDPLCPEHDQELIAARRGVA